MTFEQWIVSVNNILMRQVGLCHDDMEDWCWIDAFNDGSSPQQAVCDFLEDIGFEQDFED